MNISILNTAQISGTVGGLAGGVTYILNMVQVESLVQPVAITFLTTTISFILPLVYKRLAKRYNLN